MKTIPFLILTFLSFGAFAQNDFAFNFYSKMDKEKNLLFSPTSIKTAFALAYEGANSDTQLEFENIFGFKEDNSKFMAEMEHFKSVAEISNSIWILENYQILPSYIKTMKSNFGLEPYYAEFKKDPVGSAEVINKWIEKNTKGMIKNMLNPSDVQNFKMALINAIYFKQDWKYTFDKDLTKKDKFTNSDGTKSPVDMMHILRNYSAYEGINEKVIELTYKDDATSMVIILPNNMEDYELSNEIYSSLTAQLRQQKVNLDLPKFTFETPTFELKPFLKELGMIESFEDSADFTGMREENDLKIGTALHKAKIIVNEEGTEAAAVTVIGMEAKTTSMSPPPQIIMQMRVDKPFYYFIKDNQTGTILFMGRMNQL